MLTLRDRSKTQEEVLVPGRRVQATLASVGVHLVIVAGLWQVLQFPGVMGVFLDRSSDEPTGREERITFVQVPPKPEQVRLYRPVAPRQPAAAPAVTAPPPPAAAAGGGPVQGPPTSLTAPAGTPSGIPPVPTGPAEGPLAAGRGPVRGVQPGYTEPRVWIQAEPVYAPALEGDEKLDSAVAARVYAYRDSAMANTYQPNKYERGDWTYTTKDGKKFGIDQQFIRLGKVSIPTALLGLLPLNQIQGNPTAIDRERRLAAMRTEIINQAQMAMNEEEFRQAVKQIRARKEREQKAAEAKKKKPVEVKVISDGR
jgi:hypothetical protein